MTSINDPIRQASLFTTFGLINPRLMPGYIQKPIDETNQKSSSESWWMKITDFFSSEKKQQVRNQLQ